MAAVNKVNLSAGPINYRDSGSGPPVVFVHGLLVNGTLWRKVVPPLEGKARCIVPDWPLGSHPEPMNADADLSPRGVARLVDAFLAALDLDDVTLVANDTGGAITQLLITEQPGRVGRVVLTSCDCFDRFPPPIFRPLTLSARLPPLLNGAAQSMRLAPLRRLPIAFGWATERPIPDDVTGAWMRPVATDKRIRRDAAKHLRALDPKDTLAAADRLGSFDKPAIVAWGAQDRFFPVDYGRRLAERLPKGRFELIEGSGAFVPEDQPERVAELIGELVGPRSGADVASAGSSG